MKLLKRYYIIVLGLLIFAGILPLSCAKEEVVPTPESITQEVNNGNVKRAAAILSLNPSLASARNKEGESLVHLAVRNNDVKMLQLLLTKGADPNVCNPGCILPLHIAVARGNYETAQFLLKNGALASPEDAPVTPLMVAVDHSRENLVNLLLDNGADVNERNMGALRRAADNNDLKMITLLLERGAKINSSVKNPEWSLPLKSAAANGNLEMITIFLDKGAKINDHSGKDSGTALHAAVQEDHPDAARLLIERGAKTSVLNKSGKSPLDYARKKDNDELVASLTGKKKKKEIPIQASGTPSVEKVNKQIQQVCSKDEEIQLRLRIRKQLEQIKRIEGEM